MIQAGAVGLLGLGTNHLDALRAVAADSDRSKSKAKRVIYIFLSGGLAQHESFDMKPDAPQAIRGEFKPIKTATPGIDICEHLPMLAQRSEHWALVRSLTHPYNEHSDGHLAMFTGRTMMPPGFDRSKPKLSDWPSIAAITSAVSRASIAWRRITGTSSGARRRKRRASASISSARGLASTVRVNRSIRSGSATRCSRSPLSVSTVTGTESAYAGESWISVKETRYPSPAGSAVTLRRPIDGAPVRLSHWAKKPPRSRADASSNAPLRSSHEARRKR
ncbi:MAG: DUF1501 domain-containing protein [Proteobacteria bacterium]|nr:DUF1501 domain-containing protein [Pseudomonadota bacterium]